MVKKLVLSHFLVYDHIPAANGVCRALFGICHSCQNNADYGRVDTYGAPFAYKGIQDDL
jgi:hypothetical protein